MKNVPKAYCSHLAIFLFCQLTGRRHFLLIFQLDKHMFVMPMVHFSTSSSSPFNRKDVKLIDQNDLAAM